MLLVVSCGVGVKLYGCGHIQAVEMLPGRCSLVLSGQASTTFQGLRELGLSLDLQTGGSAATLFGSVAADVAS